MPTYTEHLFEPLEAWIDTVVDRLHAEEPAELRLIVARMLLEHSGRGGGPIVVRDPWERP